jgi:hypothetical protein
VKRGKRKGGNLKEEEREKKERKRKGTGTGRVRSKKGHVARGGKISVSEVGAEQIVFGLKFRPLLQRPYLIAGLQGFLFWSKNNICTPPKTIFTPLSR